MNASVSIIKDRARLFRENERAAEVLMTTYVDANEIAAVLRLNRNTVVKKARSGDIPAIRIPGIARDTYRFDLELVISALSGAPARERKQPQ